jgi:hypothetical protein
MRAHPCALPQLDGAAHESAHAPTYRQRPSHVPPVSPMKSRRFRTLHLAANAGESRENTGVLVQSFSSVPGTRTANGPQRRAKGTASDTVRCLTRRCSSVGAPGWATGLFGAQRAYAGEDRCDDRHRVRVRCRPGWPGAHSCPQCLQGHAGSCVRRRLDPCCISLIRSRVSSRLCPRDQRSGGRPSGSRLGRCGRSACRRRARGSAR